MEEGEGLVRGGSSAYGNFSLQTSSVKGAMLCNTYEKRNACMCTMFHAFVAVPLFIL